jgi:hypothetical protein
VRYCTIPSPKKPQAELDATPYLSPGHPPLEEAIRIPRTAAAIETRRGDDPDDATNGDPTPNDDSKEAKAKPVKAKRQTKQIQAFYAIQQLKVTTEHAFLLYAHSEASQNRTDLLDFALGHKDLGGFIHKVRTSNPAYLEERARRSGLTPMQKLDDARRSDCMCPRGGKTWSEAASEIMTLNGHTREAFARRIETCMKGPDKTTRTLMICGPSNCGKSFLINPLHAIFDNVATKPTAKSSYALQRLIGADLVLWHEVDRSIFDIIHVNDFFLWLEGDDWTIGKPKNSAAADVQWSGRGVPTLFTGGMPLTHTDPGKNTMIYNRLDFFHLHMPIPKEKAVKLARCQRCFADFVSI